MAKEILNFGLQGELFKHNEPYLEKDRRILEQILDEILEEEGKDKILSEAFFWRLIQRYNEEMGFKFKEAEIKIFFDEVFGPAVEEMLQERGRQYKFRGQARKITGKFDKRQPESTRKKTRPANRVHWTQKREDLNEEIEFFKAKSSLPPFDKGAE